MGYLILILTLASAERFIELREFERAIPLLEDKEKIGALRLRLHKYDKALPFLKEPFQIGWTYEQLHKPDSAIKYYKKASPVLRSHTLYRLAHCMRKMRKYKEAIDYYEELIVNFPRFPHLKTAMQELADCYTAIGNFGMAVNILDRAFDPPLSWYLIARVRERAGEKPRDLWIKLGSTYPESEYAKHALPHLPEDSISLIGRINYFAGSYKSAVSYLGKIKGEEELVALSLYKLGRYERTILMAKEFNLWELAGDCERKLGNPELAIQYYQKSEAPDAIFWNAKLTEELGKYDSAILLYQKVPRVSKKFEVANLRALILCIKLNKLKDALKVCKNISSPTSYYWFYRIYTLQGKRKEAKVYRKKLFKKYPFSYYSWLLDGRINVLKCSVKKALHIDRGYSLSAEQEEAFARGKLLLELGIVKEGIAELRGINVKHPLFIWRLAKLFYSHGLPHLGIQYTNKLNFSNGTPRKAAEALYPLCFLPTIDECPEDIESFLLLALIREESHFDPTAVSYANAMGLTQIIPWTAYGIAQQLGEFPYNIFDPPTNIRFGAFYINQCLDLFGDNIEFALAAYNGGPHNVRDWITLGDTTNIDEWVEQIPYDQTRRYVKKVIGSYHAYQQIYK